MYFPSEVSESMRVFMLTHFVLALAVFWDFSVVHLGVLSLIYSSGVTLLSGALDHIFGWFWFRRNVTFFFLFPTLDSYSFICVTKYLACIACNGIKASSGKCSHFACLTVCVFWLCISVLEKENIFPTYERSEGEENKGFPVIRPSPIF